MLMKYFFFLLLLVYTSALHAQTTPAADEYAKGRDIIRELQTIVTPNGLQESYQVEVGGVQHAVYVRGKDKENPIILFVHGGPASPLSPVMWTFQGPMEEYFTFVNYDQRASGRTYTLNDTAQLGKTLFIDQYVTDAIALAEHVREKYGKRKLILMGHSWGTIISMKAALQRPDLFYAYVGIGQVINTVKNEEISFAYALRVASEEKNEEALKELTSIAPYPGDKPLTRERIVLARKWPQYYGGLSAYRTDSRQFFAAPLLSPEYTRQEVSAINQGSLFTLEKVLPEFLEVNFDGIKSFPIPVFMFMGRHDYTTPSEPTAQWLAQVKAPKKQAIWFEHAAHLIPLEEPGKMLVSLLEHVRPLALEASGRPKKSR
ncbi:pimeloyl-ACP methyl ester carboxylesterase [Pontibacter mucosus]|uniref:Proline iminopeptidase n=1 Tax=Pontibacter mucosus TaxID=1649266 RepID=A0A2T5Y571_9BACT|nr:alpha/beta hydrolase [Pontibacter mucosus]PTX11417.1 pimeloyl-ACP methyl ester carboxylesterase [Pontibacter mucosus]